MALRSLICFLILCCFGIIEEAAAHAAVSAPAIDLQGDVASPRSWSVDELQKTFAADLKKISYSSAGASHTSVAIPLIAIVEAAEPKESKSVKNSQLQTVVSVKGSDGYIVDFTLGELLPSFGNEAVYVAANEDGKPLSGTFAPVELICPNELKHGRWVRGIASITVTNTVLANPNAASA